MLQGVAMLFFHVIRNEKVWSKIGPRLTAIRQKTLTSVIGSQTNEVVSLNSISSHSTDTSQHYSSAMLEFITGTDRKTSGNPGLFSCRPNQN